jgi:hypothetical protein
LSFEVAIKKRAEVFPSPMSLITSSISEDSFCPAIYRAVGRSENSGVPVLFRRHNLPPLVEIGLTDQPKIGTPRDDRPDIQYFYLSVCLSVGIGSKPSSL